jgi:hypothetical protein
LSCRAVGDRFELLVLRDALEIGEGRALHGERLFVGPARLVVADERISAFPQRLVGEVRLPFDHRRALFHRTRRRTQGLLDRILGWRLRDRDGGDRQQAENSK